MRFVQSPGRVTHSSTHCGTCGLRAQAETDCCCFDDLLRHPVCGLRLSERLTEATVSDPASASILDAMIGLAANLGMATLVTRASMAARTALIDLGVQYIGEDAPTEVRGSESAGSDRTSGRFRYQGALYGP